MKILLTYQPDDQHLASLRNAAPGAMIVSAPDLETSRHEIRDASAVLGNRFLVESLPFARQLKWVQSSSSGMDRILDSSRELLSGVTLTNCSGVYDEEVADHALALILATYRRLDQAFELRVQRRWERRTLPHLDQTRALILGWGGIGRAIGGRLRAFGVEVTGARRSTSPIEKDFRVLTSGEWRATLPRTDLLIMALPLTAMTNRIVGRDELRQLPAGARVVNVGRGPTLDEGALKAALDRGHLAGAALDVFAEEPLPADHWIWSDPRVVMTPHWGRSQECGSPRWQPLFVENLRRFCAGEALLNVVDQDAGY